MDNRLQVFDELFDGLKFKDALYSEKTGICTVNFLHNPASFKPDDENKQKIIKTLKDVVGDFVKYALNFTSCSLDKHTVTTHIYTTIVNNFPAISKDFLLEDVSVEVDHLQVTAILRLSPTAYEYATDFNRAELVAEKLKDSFLADFTVKFEKKDVQDSNISFIERNMELMESIKEVEEKTVFELTEVQDIIGKNENTIATDFTKITTPIENVVICGEIVSNQRKTYKRKVTKNGVESEIEKTFYNFAIRNENKTLYCSIFPRQADETKGDLLEEGMKVCCFGSFREFNGKLNFTASTVARCVYKRAAIKGKTKKVNDDYHTVFPKEFIDYEQKGMFDDDDKIIPGTYVVFDLETTGLESSKDEIIEVGACKVVEGKITEVFSTFVKPSRHIPKEITELTGINDDMVKDAPTINYVMPDFYKFCYGSTLVAHNISFDIGFVYAAAKKLSYNFDNPLKDTIALAKEKLPGLKNYKLGTVVDRLNIVLDNAHRAINDATATAKVFVKLM